ncbi:MAG: transcriptional regulator [Actinomycetes bacterium]
MNADDLLQVLGAELAAEEHDNQVVRAVEEGRATLGVVAALAAEETRTVASDRRSFLLLAARSADPDAVRFFAGLAQGECTALDTLPALARAAGLDDAGVQAYRVQPGCQAYPAYTAWLAVNGDPVDVSVAVLANFAAWGGYCATMARALRDHYGFDDEACAFFDLFATSKDDAGASPLEAHALRAVDARLGAGDSLHGGREYARMLQGYELMFWDCLAAAL